MSPFDLLVGGDLGMLAYLHQIILKIWQRESIPNSWKDALIAKLYNNNNNKGAEADGAVLLGAALRSGVLPIGSGSGSAAPF